MELTGNGRNGPTEEKALMRRLSLWLMFAGWIGLGSVCTVVIVSASGRFAYLENVALINRDKITKLESDCTAHQRGIDDLKSNVFQSLQDIKMDIREIKGEIFKPRP